MNESKCIMDKLNYIIDEIKSLKNESQTLRDKFDEQMDKFTNRMHFLENKTTLRLVKIDETVRKSANSINVIVRLVAGAQNISSNVLGQILIDAEALTTKVKSTTDVNFEDIPKECANADFLASHIKDLIIKAAILPSKNLSTGNPSFDPINTNISPTSVTNSTVSQTSSLQNHSSLSTSSNTSNVSINTNIPSTCATNLVISQTSSEKNTSYQNHSSSPALSNISNVSNNTSIPSTSATNSTIPETSSIQNDINKNQISSTMSSNMLNLPTNIANNPMPYIDNSSREKEKLEQEALRKKYRNKYKYLEKYKNMNQKNTTQDEKNVTEKSHLTNNKFTNINESNSEFIKAFKDCRTYRDPIFDGVKDVELIYIEEGDKDPRSVIKPLSDIQPRVLLNLIDANSVEIQQRLINGESKSSNSSKIPDEMINFNKSNRKNVTINKKIKSDKPKSETIVNPRTINIKRKGAMINNKSTPPKKRASFRGTITNNTKNN